MHQAADNYCSLCRTSLFPCKLYSTPQLMKIIKNVGSGTDGCQMN